MTSRDLSVLPSRHRGARRARRERGTASLEFVGLLPVVLIAMVLVLQLFAAAYTAHAAHQSARDAARAYSLGESPQAAAEASLPGGVDLVSVSTFGPHHGVRVVVRAPSVLKIGDPHFSSEATMP
ncbi:pilus assembly protein TadE [Microlunatus elymi]|uniref:Pilus assembly protein TadE n=1 Tax=Microlunatus elymi TaxID=2596828 RepID=A0A516PZP4_9ACTN|nr:TadE/TadG family type IV pilus assembly protein [Microlunatus elymi]QDP96617.1 pilus assembly protein TadE [Microlunatus elymi]